MKKIQKYVRDTTKKLNHLKKSLKTYNNRFEELMKYSDSEISVMNSNERILKSNPVYNSEDLSDEFKEMIQNRRLNGMNPQEFEDMYKTLLYGVSNSKPKENEIEKYNSRVPTIIDSKTAITAGHKPEYLLSFCQEYGLTKKDLDRVLALKEEYKTSFPTIGKLLSKGYSLQDIEGFFETRAIFIKTEEDYNLYPSITHIVNLYQRFGEGPVDAEDLSGKITELKDVLENIPFMDWKIEAVIRIADMIDAFYFEAVIDYIMEEKNIRNNKEDRESDECVFFKEEED